MAFKLTYEQNGYSAEYWYLKQLVEVDKEQILVSLESYKDYTKRLVGQCALGFPTPTFNVSIAASTRTVVLDGEELPANMALRKLAYILTKDQAELEVELDAQIAAKQAAVDAASSETKRVLEEELHGIKAQKQSDILSLFAQAQDI